MSRSALVAVLIVVAGSAAAQMPRFPEFRTSLVRLVGTWGPPQPGHTAAADLTVERGDVTERMQVEEARVLSGDLSGPDVLSEAQGRRPAFRLRGPAELLTQLDTARPGDQVELTGYLRSGSPDLSVTSVVVHPREPSRERPPD